MTVNISTSHIYLKSTGCSIKRYVYIHLFGIYLLINVSLWFHILLNDALQMFLLLVSFFSSSKITEFDKFSHCSLFTPTLTKRQRSMAQRIYKFVRLFLSLLLLLLTWDLVELNVVHVYSRPSLYMWSGD